MLSRRRIGAALGALFILIGLCGAPRDAHADYTQGTSCTPPAAAGIGNHAVTDGNNLVCVGGTWQYPDYVMQNYTGAVGASCSGYPAGAMHYNTTVSSVEVCNGTNWAFLAASSTACGTPGGLSFTNVTGASLNTVYASNMATITFSGCSGGTLPVSVSGASTAQISVNGGPWAASGAIASGQTLQVEMTSSSSVSTTLTATITVGSSNTTWTVTTGSAGALIFETTAGYLGASFGGLAGADADCQAAANTAGYAGTYKAVMCDDTTSASSRLTLNYPIANAYNGSTVASTNLWSGSLTNAVLNTSGGYSSIYYSQVWTGCNSNGTSIVGSTCSSWTGGSCGEMGNTGATNATWLTDNCADSCATSNPNIICVQVSTNSCSSVSGLSFTSVTGQPLGTVVSSNTPTISFSGGCGTSLSVSVLGAPTAQLSINGGSWTTSGSISNGQTLQVRMTTSGSVSTMETMTVEVGSSSTTWSTTTVSGAEKIFMTNGTYLGTGIGGLSGADAICQSEAGSAGYSGTYKAILSDDTTSAASRLSYTYPIVNACNGALVSATNFYSGSLSTMVLNPSCVEGSRNIWTGTNSNGTSSTGNTCSSWTSGGSQGLAGVDDFTTGGQYLSWSDYSCGGSGFALICLQQ